MSLRSRILLGLLLLVLLYGTTVVAVQQLILRPGFQDLERATTSRNLSRAVHAIEKDVETLESFCHDWAAWDDTYQFLKDGNSEFVAENLVLETFANGNFDVAWFVALDGRVVFGGAHEPAGEHALIGMPDFPSDRMSLDDPLLASHDIEQPVSGLLATSQGPMIASCWPVTTSLQDESSDGWLLMGKFLDSTHVSALIDQTRVTFVIRDAGGVLPPAERGALARLSAGESEVQVPASDELMHAFTTLPDILGRPAFLLRIDWPREITQHGAGVLRFALVSLLAAAALTLAAVAFMLQRTVIRPLTDLTAHAVRVGRSDDLSARVGSTRSDELGVLSREFDSMVAKLASSREQLVDAARLGGRAEVATAVLHNVGNVLNSVNTSAAELERSLASGALADLERLEPSLLAHADDLARWIEQDARGRHLPAFLLALAQKGREEHAALLAESRHLAEGLGHVSALVRGQEEHAGAVAPLERVSLARQVDCALKLSEDGAPGPPIEIRREFEDVPDVLVPRHRLLEVLVNLLRNARQSLRAAPVEARRLVVRVARAAGGVRVEVADNGLGIAKEHLVRIFQQHFTTKSDGHGIGLHVAANAAREMGGTLAASSDGPGTGATFVLQLPAAPAGRET